MAVGLSGRSPGVLLLHALLSGAEFERSRRCRGRDVIPRRRTRLAGALTFRRAELRCNAAASPGRGAGLASAHPLPGETRAGVGSEDKGWRVQRSSLTLAHRLQGMNVLAEEAVQSPEKPEPVATAGEVAGVAPRRCGHPEL